MTAIGRGITLRWKKEVGELGERMWESWESLLAPSGRAGLVGLQEGGPSRLALFAALDRLELRLLRLRTWDWRGAGGKAKQPAAWPGGRGGRVGSSGGLTRPPRMGR